MLHQVKTVNVTGQLEKARGDVSPLRIINSLCIQAVAAGFPLYAKTLVNRLRTIAVQPPVPMYKAAQVIWSTSTPNCALVAHSRPLSRLMGRDPAFVYPRWAFCKSQPDADLSGYSHAGHRQSGDIMMTLPPSARLDLGTVLQCGGDEGICIEGRDPRSWPTLRAYFGEVWKSSGSAERCLEGFRGWY